MQEMIVLQTETEPTPAGETPSIRVYRPTPQKVQKEEEPFDFEKMFAPPQPEKPREDPVLPQQDQPPTPPENKPGKPKLLSLKLCMMAVLLGAFVWCYPKLSPSIDGYLYRILQLSVGEIGESFFDTPQEEVTQPINEQTSPQPESEQPEQVKEQQIQQSSPEGPAIVGTAENTTGDGKVKVQTFSAVAGGIYVPLQHGLIKNVTKQHNSVIEQAVKQDVAFTLTDTDKPQILLMHTHTTESYLSKESGSFDTEARFRSTDKSENMARVGEAAAAVLKEAGIGVIHDTILHDHPSYSGSYARSAETVKAYLKEYPSIRIVLDLHRDAIGEKDEIIAPTATVDGKKAAQLMIVSGCDDGTMGMPHYLDNLAFAAKLQNHLEQLYPTLTRPVLFDYRKYNQDLTTGSLLIEVGSSGNTLEQAVYSGELLGHALVRFFETEIGA